GERGPLLPLTVENIGFVNEVFLEFTRQASESYIKSFDLDRADYRRNTRNNVDWEQAVPKEASRLIPHLERAMNKFSEKIYPVDPLLFMALMKRESNFDPLAVSSVGAAGLTQIMPQTAKDLGMTDIYMPAYFREALSIIQLERQNRRHAVEALFQINETTTIAPAKRSREFMQKSLQLKENREKLFLRYKKDLVRRRSDDRLQPEKAIEYGYKYFATLLKKQNGDISLALASYNAGPHRVKEYKGIPPFEETVLFRNRVLQFYRDFLNR
ncbi:lytic transglycosylase domain-containing protein, partial [Thermodesulfobacteriota bacterium]